MTTLISDLNNCLLICLSQLHDQGLMVEEDQRDREEKRKEGLAQGRATKRRKVEDKDEIVWGGKN